ncbi:hypothetical protein ACAW74_21240 [Fibrella sp. WM1]|uniref:hypothetical protein n=1 Tax=Fibrella musci TaxID=3242485 RepID=UPI003521285B
MKSYSLRAWLLLLLPLCVAFTCSDHREPQPLRYRLKTVNYNGSYDTFYLTYDSNGRLTRYNYGPNRGAVQYDVSYDSLNRVKQLYFIDQGLNGNFSNGYIYNQHNQLSQVERYYLPVRIFYPLPQPSLASTYLYDYTSTGASTPARLTTRYTNYSLDQAYTFSGGNAIKVGDKEYTYDDKPNPYKGLFGLNLNFGLDPSYASNEPVSPFSPSQRFTDLGVKVYNQNNITTGAKLTYNSDGLVTKIVYDNGTFEEFTYEAY